MRRLLILMLAGLALLSAAGVLGMAQARDTFRRAFLHGFPVYEFARMRAAAIGAPGAAGTATVNHLLHRPNLTGAADRTVTTPNNDTLYSAAWLDLSGGPVLLTLPALPTRYHSVALIDAYTDNIAVLGSRDGGGRGGRVMVAGPDWQGSVPADVRFIRATTNDLWLLIRVLVTGPDDLASARAAQAAFTLDGPAALRPFAHAVPLNPGPAEFVDVVGEMLARSPTPTAATARSVGLAAYGVAPGARFAGLSWWARLVWRLGLPLARARLDNPGGPELAGGWTVPVAGIGNAGENDALRARVALVGFGALPAEEAVYYRGSTDGAGQVLDGGRRYRLHLGSGGPPVDGFWSVGIYERTAEGRLYFHANALDRHALGDRSPGLVRNPDGSIDILLQHDAPAGDRGNWLPAPPGHFELTLRAYLPRQEVRDGRWSPPALNALP